MNKLKNAIPTVKEKLADLFVADHPQTAYLTGLRAYAALMVFLIHSRFKTGYSFLDNFVLQGQYGVIIFFVLSSYLISLTIIRAKNGFNLRVYWERRVLRILPLYFLANIILYLFCLIHPGFGNPYWRDVFNLPHDFKSLLAHLSVFYGLFDQRYLMNGIGIDWTIPIEFSFYLILPLWVYAIYHRKNIVPAVLLTIVFYFLFQMSPDYLVLNTHGWDQKTLLENRDNWLASSYVPYFFVPCVLACLSEKYQVDYRRYKARILLYAAFCLLLWNLASPFESQKLVYGLISLLLLFGCRDDSVVKRHIFENRFVIMFGKISFSFYLLHFTLLEEFKFLYQYNNLRIAVIFILTTILAIFSYLLIERPAQNLKWKYRNKPSSNLV